MLTVPQCYSFFQKYKMHNFLCSALSQETKTIIYFCNKLQFMTFYTIVANST